jgi:choline dehydrogenase-like flavoprotein
MFIDSRTLNSNKTVSSDICIVGAGVAGISMAREFTTAGFKTSIIESGGLKPDKTTQSLYWGENVGIPYYPLDTARARFFGGSSHYWHIKLPEKGMGVRLRPMDPIDFETRDWIPYSGWPYNKSALDPYYERAQQVCQIGPFNYDPEYWSDSARSPLKLNGHGAQTTMFQFAEREIFFKQYKTELEQSSQIDVYLHGNVTNIEATENAGTVTRLQVDCLNQNRFYIKAKYFVVALGGIETPRLLLLSNKVCKQGLGNQNDLVGRFFMEHPHLWSGTFVPFNLNVSNSTGLYQVYRKNNLPLLAKLAVTEKTLRKEKLANWCTSIHPDYQLSYQKYMQRDKKGVAAFRALKSKSGRTSMVRHVTDILSDPSSVALAAVRKIRGGFQKQFDRDKHIAVFRLNHMVEQTPNPESRVMLSGECDALGQRRVNLDWRLNDIDIRTITRAQQILDKHLRQAGLGYLNIETRPDEIPADIHGGWHHMGTTRMHEDPKQGVVDTDCKVHGTSNLYIAGASTFPTVGYANPVLTTIAVVLRMADHLKQLMA